MNTSEIVIRKIKQEDISAIFSLVEELAIYEKALDQIKVDEEYYRKEWSKNTFDAIVALDGNQVIGTCIYYMTFSTWKGRCMYLEDFVVKEKYRRSGVGQLLYDRFLEESKAQDSTMVRWQVLDWNDPAVKFYEKNEAIIDKGWWNCKIFFK